MRSPAMTHRILLNDTGLLGSDQLHRLKSNLMLGLDHIARTEDAGCAFELSVSFVSDREIQEINRQFRQKDSPTDVLSFSQYEGEPMPAPDGVQPLGDLIVSVETAGRQSTAIGHSEEYELNRLLVHGLFHLLGYDHERSAEEERLMQEREDALLQLLEEHGSIP